MSKFGTEVSAELQSSAPGEAWQVELVRGGTSPEGLPIGVQVVAAPSREDVALAVALRLEAATGGFAPPPM